MEQTAKNVRFFDKIKEAEFVIKVGNLILNELREKDPELFAKIMSEPVKACRCGNIQEGDYTICPKCENVQNPFSPESGSDE